MTSILLTARTKIFPCNFEIFLKTLVIDPTFHYDRTHSSGSSTTDRSWKKKP